MKTFFKAFMMIFLGIPVSYASETIEELRAKGVDIEIVKEIEEAPNASGVYFHETGKIELDVDHVTGSRRRSDIIAAHEMIHKVRYENGLWSKDRVLEEYVAVYGAEQACKVLFNKSYRINETLFLKATLHVNRLNGKVEERVVRKEVNKTIRLLKELYGE